MKASFLQELVMGVPVTSAYKIWKSSKRHLPDSDGQYNTSTKKSKQNRVNSVLRRMNKLGRKADSFAHGVREHVRLGPNFTDTVKGKLSLGARILQVGGVEKVFMRLFSVREGESETSIKISSPNGELNRFNYKVLIPLDKIKCVNQSENVKKPSQKYINIVTVDDFDFWLMGFLNHQKALRFLQRAISQA
ncbi:hypothetical protein L6164_020914 [Bauhinia variegata]|uniref:Uncharacterized protein n=1 Tax=Bauhinia variegata TaxID=167791 RepID=A0ACB9MWX7_BAUVA|nr:hypothetical protein L6164_020914 [Bauhinia variegata]